MLDNMKAFIYEMVTFNGAQLYHNVYIDLTKGATRDLLGFKL